MLMTVEFKQCREIYEKIRQIAKFKKIRILTANISNIYKNMCVFMLSSLKTKQ